MENAGTNRNPYFSIICASNDKVKLDTILAPSLEKQKFRDFEFLTIKASEHGFKSASETLNYAENVAKGKFLVFVHQDVGLISENFLSQLKIYCDKYKFGIAGVAGLLSYSNFQVFSTVYQGPNREIAGKINKEVVEAVSLDECLLIIPKKDFLGFESLGQTWHLYGPEYSLKCKKQELSVLLFPLDIYHFSCGESLNSNYFDTIKLFGKRHKEYKVIPTTMGSWKNNAWLPLLVKIRKTKFLLKHLFNLNQMERPNTPSH